MVTNHSSLGRQQVPAGVKRNYPQVSDMDYCDSSSSIVVIVGTVRPSVGLMFNPYQSPEILNHQITTPITKISVAPPAIPPISREKTVDQALVCPLLIACCSNRPEMVTPTTTITTKNRVVMPRERLGKVVAPVVSLDVGAGRDMMILAAIFFLPTTSRIFFAQGWLVRINS